MATKRVKEEKIGTGVIELKLDATAFKRDLAAIRREVKSLIFDLRTLRIAAKEKR